jgi:hypothetical protein
MPPDTKTGATKGTTPGTTPGTTTGASLPPIRSIHDGLMALITGRPGADGASSEAETLVLGDARASADERVHVYAHMYRARMVEALESQFPRLARWLGADAFSALTFDYVTDQPSRHPSLRFIGQRLADWLAAHPAALPAQQPAWDDLVRLEWARADVFDAADESTLTLEIVRGWPPDQFAALPLRLIGAHRLLTVAHPAAALWDAIGADPRVDGADQDPLSPSPSPAASPITPRAESLLVWRQGVSVFHRAVEDAERIALETLVAGTTFGAVCDALLVTRDPEEATAQAFAWLSTWASDELLIAPWQPQQRA